MVRERWPNERRSVAPNHRWLLSSSSVLRVIFSRSRHSKFLQLSAVRESYLHFASSRAIGFLSSTTAGRSPKNAITADAREQAARKYSPASKLPVASFIQPTA